MYQKDLFWKRSLKTVAAPLSRGWAAARSTFTIPADGHNQVVILAYHRVVASVTEAERDSIYGLVISADSFARHMEIVQSHYEVLTLDEALLVLRGKRRLTRTAAVITFDDGYRDVYENAWPILKQQGMPAIVYVPTAFMGSNRLLDHDRLYWLVMQARAAGIDLHKPLADAKLLPQQVTQILAARHVAQVADMLNYHPFAKRQAILQSLDAQLWEVIEPYPASYQLMSWEMIHEMAAGGISFGAHSDRHLILTLETEATAQREIERSKRILEEQLKQPIQHFAYPNGYFNSVLKTMVARAGFVSAVTTARTVARRGDEAMALGRLSLCEESTRGITGSYSEAVARLRLAT